MTEETPDVVYVGLDWAAVVHAVCVMSAAGKVLAQFTIAVSYTHLDVYKRQPLDLPERVLATKGVWWTITPQELAAQGVGATAVPGAAHGAEHAAISLLPLIATADRWDIGGVSTAVHPDTGLPTIMAVSYTHLDVYKRQVEWVVAVTALG